MLHHFKKSHESQITDMPNQVTTGSSHFITTPTAYISLMVPGFNGLDEIRPMQVA
jgi:hypothetical protein